MLAKVNLVNKDTTTQGSWIGVYGADGYNLHGLTASLPSYATESRTGTSDFTWSDPDVNAYALQKPGGASRFASGWYSSTSLTYTITVTGGPRKVSFYCCDFDNSGRTQTVKVEDVVTGKLLHTFALSNNGEMLAGVWLSYIIDGSVKFTFTVSTGPNCVVSAALYDTPPITVKTIKPAGGGDFTNLDSWWTYAQGQTGIQKAECYGGGDLNPTFTVGPNDGSPDILYIYAAPGQRHAGMVDTGKAYINCTGRTIQFARKNLYVDGIQYIRGSPAYLGYMVEYDSSDVITNCIFSDTTNSDYAIIRFKHGQYGNCTAFTDNNIFYKDSATNAGIFEFHTNNAGDVVRHELTNNTIYHNNGIVFEVNINGVNKVNLLLKNNIFLRSTNATIYSSNFSTDTTIVSGTDYNLYSYTASLAGTHNIINAVATNVLTNVFSDWSLKSGSAAIDAGTSDAFSTIDIIGTTRPQGAAYDIGAFERVVPIVDNYYNEVISDSPIGYYRQSDSDVTMRDFSGGGHHGSYVNFPDHGVRTLVKSGDACTRYSNASWATFPTLLTDIQNCTMEFWFIWNGSFDEYIVKMGDLLFTPNSSISNRPRFVFHDIFVSGTFNLEQGKIYYCVCVVKDNKLKLYLNSILQGTSTGTISKTYRLLSVDGPIVFEAALTTVGMFTINNTGDVVGSSIENVIQNNVSGLAITTFWDGSPIIHTYPSDHFHTIGNVIWLEDLFGMPGCDYDFNDVYWRVNYTTNTSGDNFISKPFNGPVDEVAIYNYALSEERIIVHWLTGQFTTTGNTNVSDILLLSDHGVTATIYGRSFSDTLHFTDFKGSSKFITDTLHFTDRAVSKGKFFSFPTDNLRIRDISSAVTLEHGTTKIALMSDLLTLADSLEANSSIIIIDTLSISDNFDTPGLHFAAFNHELTLSDSLKVIVPGKFFVGIQDTLTFNSDVSFNKAITRLTTSDTLNFAHTIGVWAPNYRTLRDTLNLVDIALSRGPNHFYPQDLLTLVDVGKSKLAKFKQVDNLNFTEKLRVSPIKLGVSDQFDIDDIAFIQDNHQFVKDTFNLTDDFKLRESIAKRFLNDTLTFSDLAKLEVGSYHAFMSDSLIFSDLLVRILPIQNIVDTISFTDSGVRIKPVTLADVLTLLDTMTGTSSNLNFDTLNFTDSLCLRYRIGFHISDNLNLSDNIIYLNNDHNDILDFIDVAHFVSFTGTYDQYVTDDLNFIDVLESVDKALCGTYNNKRSSSDTLNFQQSLQVQRNGVIIGPDP